MKSIIRSYVNLTKPTIVLLFALTGIAAMVIERTLMDHPFQFWMVFLGIVLTASSANALNMYCDRDIDQIMKRTRAKRPLPLNQIPPLHALIFGLVIGVIATALLWYFGSLTAAAVGVFTIAFYVGFYTLYLKRRTPYNIVIGGAAGATAPLIGWAAATGNLWGPGASIPWLLFLIIFIWTPPHFWALALVMKQDYEQAKIPMLPNVAGDERTRVEIILYSILLVGLTFWPALLRTGGLPYIIGSILLGILFLHRCVVLFRTRTDRSAYAVFGYSIIYLFVLFILLMIGSINTIPYWS